MQNVLIRGVFLVLLVGTLVTGVGLAQQEDIEDYSTRGFYNGRFWNAIDDQTRILFLKGIEEGISLFYQLSAIETQESSVEDQTENLFVSLTVKGFRFSEVADQVDEFYEDSSNIRIPIAYGYVYAVTKMKGAESVELERYVSQLRSTWNR